jgi:hypothetical protein
MPSGAVSAKRFRRIIRLPAIAAALILPGLALAQPADDAAKCQAAAGSYLTALRLFRADAAAQ